jgi:type II secretory pathway component PulK
MERLHIAYLLIALMATAVVAGIAYRRHHSPARAYRRRLLRDSAAHMTRMAEQKASAKSENGI